MCGIAGGYFWGGAVDPESARRAVRAMVDAEEHRGPDGRGVVACGPAQDARAPYAVLGHTRLAIIDTSSAGAQPMGGPDGSPWVSFNGEIYNFGELRRALSHAGQPFTSQTDTEVILRGYQAWGADVVQRLRGMFAFALWDPAEGRLLVARDRLGIKPVYVYRGDGYALFASEVRALLASGLVPRRIDVTGLWQYLGYQAPAAPRTLVDGVRAMPPGSWLSLAGEGALSEGTYWRMLDSARRPLDVSEAEATRLVADRLRDAVATHLVSDVPVGAFLSGGIDSSAVVALMKEAGVVPRTFSVGFTEQQFDESRYAMLMARTVGADHTHVPLTGAQLLDQLPAALAAMDQPTGDGVNTYVVSGAVRSCGIKVALSGLGGDEIFGGYPSFARLLRVADAARVWGRMPDAVRRLAASAVRVAGGDSIQASKTAALVDTDGEISSMFPLLRQVLSADQRAALMPPSRAESVADDGEPYAALLRAAFASAPGASAFAQISYAEARTYMHDVLLRDTDQMSMAHALEVRVPLLDHELVDLVTSLPDACKVSNGTPKRLLVEALGPMLPDAVVHRPKQGFTLPFDPWMRGPLRSFCEARLGDRGLAGRDLLSGSAVAELWASFIGGGRNVSWSRVWVLVVLEDWLARNGIA